MKQVLEHIKNVLTIKYDKNAIIHNAVIVLCALLCALTCLQSVKNIKGKDFPAPLTTDFMQFQQYTLQFSAFLNGSIALEAEPVDKLKDLEDPYDPINRAAVGLKHYTTYTDSSFLWDTAYYDGQYYSYFGIAPILTVYYPYYFCTGMIPGLGSASLILALMAILFITLAYREIVIRFCPNANLWLMSAALIGSIWASGVFVGLSYADNYYIAVLSALEWSMATIFFGFRAMRAEKTLPRCLLLAASALSLTLTVWSRPTTALMCLILAPAFIQFAFKTKKENLRSQLISIASFVIPLMIGATAVMAYNYIRFDSPFEFGSIYQLTVNNIADNKPSLSLFLPAIGVYFFQQPSYAEEFPHIAPSSFTNFGFTEKYIYISKTVGAFFFALPLGLFDTGIFIRPSKDKTKLPTFLLLILLAISVAFLDFSLAGVNMRYLFDFLPLISIFGAVALMDTAAETKGAAKAISSFLLVIASSAAVLVAIGIVKSNPKDIIFAIPEVLT